MDKIKTLCRQHREIISYIFWGVMTTIVNYVVYFLCTRLLGANYIAGNVVAWILAVLFAYVTNKKFVFCTPWASLCRVIRELLSFVSGRIASLVIETVILYLFIDLLHMNDIIVKIFSNILVVILNYVFAKLFAFRKSKS